MDSPQQDPGDVTMAAATLLPTAADEGPPTLAEAFMSVRAALEGVFADNLPALAECELVQALYHDGNAGVAWRRIVLLLEIAVNAPLRQ